MTDVEQSPGKPVGIVGRWLTHWLFWVAYVVAVVVFLVAAKPWRKWLDAYMEATATTGVLIHDSRLAPGRTEHMALGSVLLVRGSAGDPAPGWLPCDGRGIHKDEYPKLHELLLQVRAEERDLLPLPDVRGLQLALLSTGSGVALCDNLRMGPETSDQNQATGDALQFWIKAK